MKIRPQKGLTFDDVLLIPQRSSVSSRQDVNTVTSLTNTIELQVPIISANMDTVTETSMAIAIARLGGIGIIHRFMPTEKQIQMIIRVKRAEGIVVEHPTTISQAASIDEAKQVMQTNEVGGLVVTGKNHKLIGLVTQRDVLLAPDSTASITSVMTYPKDIISCGPNISLSEAQEILHKHRLEKLPIIDETGNLIGLITAQDVIRKQRHPESTLDEKGRLRVGGAIGVGPKEFERAASLIEAGADVIVVDIAHGHADHCVDMVKILKSNFPNSQVIAGNIATSCGAVDLAEAGADAIKVGIGPGSICTTRIVTGFGVPQLTAILNAVNGLENAGIKIPVIADGGIKTSGDMVKALAAGASTVMIGSLFAGCEEAPGAPVIRDGRKYKVIRGMASLGATIGRKVSENNEEESAESQKDWAKVVPEGVEAVVPYRGNLQEVMYQLVGGLRSGLSYGGARTIKELQENCEFIEITHAGVRESNHHDVNPL